MGICTGVGVVGQRRLDSGYILTCKAIRICWLAMGCEEKEEPRSHSRLLTGAIGKMELPSSEIRKAADGPDFRVKIWCSYLKFLGLKCLLNLYEEMSSKCICS